MVNVVVVNEAEIWGARLVFSVDEDFVGSRVLDVHSWILGRGSRIGGGGDIYRGRICLSCRCDNELSMVVTNYVEKARVLTALLMIHDSLQFTKITRLIRHIIALPLLLVNGDPSISLGRRNPVTYY